MTSEQRAPRSTNSDPPAADAVPVSGARKAEPDPATGQVGDYAGLDGKSGRDVYFRPDRYQRAELGPIGTVIRIKHGEAELESELVDVSQNGVAFNWTHDLSVQVGTVLPEVVVRFDGHEAYRGEARVSSVRLIEGRTVVGASFIDSLMNIEDVLHLRDVKAWAADSSAEGISLAAAPWRVVGHERFKGLVAELRLFLEDARGGFAELEDSLPWNVAHGENESPAREALMSRIRAEFGSGVIELSGEIDQALRSAVGSQRDALREFSTRHLHQLLMQSPWMHRARHKPLGYPGDFELMNRVYGNHFNGATLFAKAIDLSFAWTPAAVAVRARKDMIKERLARLISSKAGTDPVRILSIAAGPAEEVYELLSEHVTLSRPVEIVLFDQDKRALSFSYGRLQRLVSTRFKDQASVLHLHDSIKHLLRGKTTLRQHGTFDAVYSSGLFDYLQLPTAISLCRSLYELVAPGGTLYVGNMVPENPCRWFMELHLDWYLVYRHRSQMFDLARKAAPDATVEVIEESTGINPFVRLTRE